MENRDVTFNDIEDARDVLKGVLRFTPLEQSRTLSELTSMDLHLKLENLQKTGSFKIRGAYYKIYSLSDSEKRRGVVAASAGNHAQGVAYAATLLGAKSTIVMPETASPAKVDATRGYGATVILHGSLFDETLEMAKQIALKEGSTFVHPFNDPRVIAGQGTIGLEIMDAQPDIECIVVPVGGGGLISGVSLAAKGINPSVQMVGVQSEAFPGVLNALSTPGSSGTRDTIADGIAVKQPGDLTLSIIKRMVDNIVLVGDDDISHAVFFMLERMKILAEPAGAAGVAACMKGLVNAYRKKCAAVVSGGNIDMYTLDQIVIKGLEREHRLLRLSVILFDKPGYLEEILDVVARARANVVKIEHDRVGRGVPVGKAMVTLDLETQNFEHTQAVLSALGKFNVILAD